jgi:hypothetical protein
MLHPGLASQHQQLSGGGLTTGLQSVHPAVVVVDKGLREALVVSVWPFVFAEHLVISGTSRQLLSLTSRLLTRAR